MYMYNTSRVHCNVHSYKVDINEMNEAYFVIQSYSVHISSSLEVEMRQ